MIVVQLKGGMGNQMFEYAFGRFLSLEYNDELRLDLEFLNRRDLGEDFVYRNYDLELFELEVEFLSERERKLKMKRIEEPHFHFSESLMTQLNKNLTTGFFRKKKNVFLDGYWQSPKYFNNIENIIRSEFGFKSKIEDCEEPNIANMRNQIHNSNSVMINIRRADYLNTDYHGVLGVDFINQGVEIINSKIPDAKYFVFSDDIDWCRENIKLENMVLVDHSHKGKKFGYYLQLMRDCKHFIIPNSTFAWWAAWLSTSENKIVIAPKKWFGDDSIITNDLIPEEWIRI